MKEQVRQGNRQKSILYVLLTIAVIAVLCLTIRFVSHAESKGTVKSSNVNVRSLADAASNAVGTVTTNDAVTILEEVSGADGKTWYKISTAGGISGYVRSDFITKSADSSTAPTAKVTATEAKTAYVSSGGSVRIRKDASTKSDVVATAGANSELTITGEATATDGYKWYQVKFMGNGSQMTGFIRSDLVTFEAPAQEPEITEITGTMGEGQPTEEQPSEVPETPEQPAEEQPADVPADTADPNVAPSAGATVSDLSVLEPTAAPEFLPAGFEEVDLKLGDSVVTAYAKGDYYILYATKGDSEAQWYVYDYKNAGFISYDGFLTQSDIDANQPQSGVNFKLIVIILVAVVVILLVVIGIMGYKLTNVDYEYYDEDEDDAGEYYEDEEPIEEPVVPTRKKYVQEDEEEERPVRKEKQVSVETKAEKRTEKKSEKPKKNAGKKFMDFFTVEVDDDDEDYEDYDDEEPVEEEEDDFNFIDL